MPNLQEEMEKIKPKPRKKKRKTFLKWLLWLFFIFPIILALVSPLQGFGVFIGIILIVYAIGRKIGIITWYPIKKQYSNKFLTVLGIFILLGGAVGVDIANDPVSGSRTFEVKEEEKIEEEPVEDVEEITEENIEEPEEVVENVIEEVVEEPEETTTQNAQPVQQQTMQAVEVQVEEEPEPFVQVESAPTPEPIQEPDPIPEPEPQVEVFREYQNCTELRVDFPSGVPADHPAYRPKFDRDNDGWGCE
ncbi:MAG: excalibur calcium-binding domain-containing protein [Turicibacter sp.]|nr:excalibur calcium-binding domain-containing protein [Turicibacter sp.]